MAAVLGAEFSLDSALKNFMVPLIVSSKSPAKTLLFYISLYLKEEVKEESLVRNVGNFARYSDPN
jgi:hypothetical protein